MQRCVCGQAWHAEGLELCSFWEHCGCVRALLCVHVQGGGQALSASPSLQHSLSFSPGRLLRNVSGREAKNIHFPPSAHCWG